MRLLFGALFMVFLAFCSSISLAASPADTLKQEPTISVPVNSWNELKWRLMRAESSINNSKQALQQANSLTAMQGDELSRLKTINEKQGQELTEAHNTINRLESELAKAKADSVKQEATLNEMQKSLEALKNKIERDNRTIKRLRMQRNLSQVVGAGAIIGVVIHR